jgi:eukaryotic-like serine/threonine-protein kinase
VSGPGGAEPGAGPPRLLSGRYALGEAIGSGGMSTVYRALDRSLGRPVAVKVIRHGPVSPDELAHLRERFRREAASVARIPPHPNVVQVFDFGTDPADDLDFIVMEMVEGRDLRAVLRERRPELGEGVRLLVEAARGVGAGHRAGVVHRDLKPANLLVTDAGGGAGVKVLDFGIARVLDPGDDDDLTRVTGLPLTPAYAAPEQLAGTTPSGPATDVYQLGLVAFEVLAGERAFTREERERIRRGERVPLAARGAWAEVPEAVRAVVERALDPDSAARYRDAEALAEALAAALAGAPLPRAAGEEETLAGGAGAEDATVALPPAEAPGPASLPGGPRAARRALPARALRRLAIAGGAVALLLALAWWIPRVSDGERSVPDGDPGAGSLEEAFVPLLAEAAARVREPE